MNVGDHKKTRILGKIIFVLYIMFVLYFLLLSDWYGRSGGLREYRYNLVLFKEIRRFWTYRRELGIWTVLANLLGNILIFVPFGFFLPMASRRRSFLASTFYSFGFSLCVEIFQILSRVGSFDVDDLLLNTAGGILGYILFIICYIIRRKHGAKREG